MPVRACPYVWPYVKKKKTLKPLARNKHTGLSFALECPYVHGHTCVTVRANQKKQQLSNNHTGRSFAVVNDDWIGALCLRKSRKKSRKRLRKYRNRESTDIEKERIQ